MKKLVFSIAVIALILSCNGKKEEDHGHEHNADGTHQQTESSEHPEEVKQEEFTVGNDSIAAPGHDQQHKESEPHHIN